MYIVYVPYVEEKSNKALGRLYKRKENRNLMGLIRAFSHFPGLNQGHFAKQRALSQDLYWISKAGKFKSASAY